VQVYSTLPSAGERVRKLRVKLIGKNTDEEPLMPLTINELHLDCYGKEHPDLTPTHKTGDIIMARIPPYAVEGEEVEVIILEKGIDF